MQHREMMRRCAIVRWLLPSLVATLLILFTVVVEAGCGTSCQGNNECTDVFCTHCDVSGRCRQGVSCGSSCNVTSDCDQASNCTLCTEGICTSGCFQPCKTNAECQRYACDQCVDGFCALWQCNVYCSTDETCTIGGYDGCQMCDTNLGLCRSRCGSLCNVDDQCPPRCPFCVGGVCTVT